MANELVAAIGLFGMFFLIVAGTPIAFAMAFVGVLGTVFLVGLPV